MKFLAAFAALVLAFAGEAISPAQAEYYRSVEEAEAAREACWQTASNKLRIYSASLWDQEWEALYRQHDRAGLAAHAAKRRQQKADWQNESARCSAISDLISRLGARARAAARAAAEEERQRAPDRAASIVTRFMPSDVGSSVLGAFRAVQSGVGTARSLLSDYRAMTSGDPARRSATAIGWAQSLSGMAGGPMAGYRDVGFRVVQGLHSHAQSQLESAFANFDRDMAGSAGGGYRYAMTAAFRPMLASRNAAYAHLTDAIQQLQQGDFQALPERTAQLASLVAAVKTLQEAERREAQARTARAQAAARAQAEREAAVRAAIAQQQAEQAAALQRQFEEEDRRRRAYEEAQQAEEDYARQQQWNDIARGFGAALGAAGARRGSASPPPAPRASGSGSNCVSGPGSAPGYWRACGRND